jgi:hypothetical protein
MQQFIAKHQDQITGTLSGFDRLVFRGTLRSIAYAAGMHQYLSSNEVMMKNFGSHVEHVSQQLKTASLAEAMATARPRALPGFGCTQQGEDRSRHRR